MRSAVVMLLRGGTRSLPENAGCYGDRQLIRLGNGQSGPAIGNRDAGRHSGSNPDSMSTWQFRTRR
jgi:hypothetical protein